ncbi:MAG: thiol-disulfide oxidoreductase, partial [Snowella sp.]
VFRRVYEILGIGWIYGATKWPIIGHVVDAFYGIWADWRLALTGRPDLKTILAQREERLKSAETGRCRI